ncbi:hypothetical protein MPSEU_000368200 [Mayamaea pseudoterrestris]|nr:hypothetical protein MPSEU_000368200 [Mayamaea pseudoterrestris]
MLVTKSLRIFLLQPWLWTAVVAVVAYYDKDALHGGFVYDDNGSIKSNVVVNGNVPFNEILTRDYWGSPMADIQSHKSFRPITTATFRLNWIVSEQLGTNATDHHTYGFHIVNTGLHGIVTGLVTHATTYMFHGNTQADLLAQLITGLLFGLHPVHAEVVSNLTSRGEMLMMLFSLAAFISFAKHVHQPNIMQQFTTASRILGVYVIPWICMILSLFCKEQGATTLMSLVVYDYVHNHSDFVQLCKALRRGDSRAMQFVKRTLILAVQTISVCALRYWLNGETTPDFVSDQNPAGFAKDRFTRVFSVSWVYCLYIWDILMPIHLSPDWSGVSIPLIESIRDKRVFIVMLLWALVAAAAWSLCIGPSSTATRQQVQSRKVGLIGFWSFTFCPFLLSSNLLVVVGLMKADRVLYSPLMGFCVLEALLIRSLCEYMVNVSLKEQRTVTGKSRYWLGYMLYLLQMGFFAANVHERNLAWSDSLNLWMRAYRINPKSSHTMYNCGYELSLKKRYDEAEQVLRPIGNPHVDGPSNTFVYAMVLYNLNRCDEANDLIDSAIDVLEEKRKIGGPRNTDKSLNRVESNLMVARSFCTKDLPLAGKIMYDAVQVDPSNEYAIQQATNMMNHIQQQTMINEQKKRLGIA